MIQESYIPPEAHSLLRDYAQGPHYTNDLMIGTANKVEIALAKTWLMLVGEGYNAGIMTRLFSRLEEVDLPDVNFQYLRNPKLFLQEVMNQDPSTLSDGGRLRRRLFEEKWTKSRCQDVQDFHREMIAKLVGSEPDVVGNGNIRRLLDKPVITDLVIQYFNEHKVPQFQKKLAESQYYRPWKHRLEFTRNRARHRKPSTLGSYILRTFCPEGTPSVESRWETPSIIHDLVHAEREEILTHLPINPDAISDESLIKVGLAPQDFMIYTPQARRRYKMAVAPQFLALLAKAKMTVRLHAGKVKGIAKSTARVITFSGADGEEKVGIFSTVTDVSTQVSGSEGKEKNRHHRLADTELRIFAGRDEAIRSQEHALEKMKERIWVYSELYNKLCDYARKGAEKSAFLSELVEKTKSQFIKKTGYHDQLILRYLIGSSEGKPTPSVLNNPSLIGVLKNVLTRAIADTKGKIVEVNLLKDQI